jgi:hypothetical protein
MAPGAAPANFGLASGEIRILNDALNLRIDAGADCRLLITDCGLRVAVNVLAAPLIQPMGNGRNQPLYPNIP